MFGGSPRHIHDILWLAIARHSVANATQCRYQACSESLCDIWPLMLRYALLKISMVFLLVGAFAPAFAAEQAPVASVGRYTASNIGAPVPTICSGPRPDAAYTIRDALPGAWRNPERFGTGWDLHRDDEQGSLSVTWYTYDAARRPVWYRSSVAQMDPLTQTWRSAIQRVSLDPRTDQRAAAVDVGAVSIRFLQDEPGKLAIRWGLNDGSLPPIDECLVDAFGEARGSQWRAQRWIDPSSQKFELMGTSLDEAGWTGNRYTVLGFDTAGAPVWTVGVRPQGVSSGSPVGLEYRYSNYPGGVPSAICAHSGCISAARPAGVLTPPSLSQTPETVLSLELSSAEVDQRLALAQNGAVQVLNGAQTSANFAFLSVTPSGNCTIGSGQTSCLKTLAWSTNYTWVSIVKVRTDTNPAQTTVLSNAQTGSNFLAALTAGVWQFQIQHRTSGVSYYSTASITVGNGTPPPGGSIGFQPALACRNSSVPVSPGTTPGISGRWWNSQRDSTGWDLLFTEPEGTNPHGTVTATWSTFGSNGEPTWLVAPVMQIETTVESGLTVKRATGALRKFIWNSATQSASSTSVGQVALSFVPDDATRASLRWSWNEAPAQTYYDECISEYSRQVAARSTNVNQAYTGSWQESGVDGFGFSVYMASLPGSALREAQTLNIYDTAGQPRWVVSTLADPTASASDIPVYYTRSPFNNSVPITPCSGAGCLNLVDVGRLSRIFDANGATGQAKVDVSHLNSNVTLNWHRREISSGVTAFANINKIARTNEIVANRQICTLSTGPCEILISWTGPLAEARAYRVDLATNQWTMLDNPAAGVGSSTESFVAPGRYRYYLAIPGVSGLQVLANSAEVVINGQLPPSQITVDRTSCTLGASPCNVQVNWSTNVNTTARAYRRRTDGPGGSVKLPVESAIGNYTDTLTVAGSYVYELKQTDSATAANLAVSPSVVATSSTPTGEDWLDTAVATPPTPTNVVDLASPAGSVEVGSTGGEFRVNEGGNATYRIPIYIAPATGGVAPEASLEYSSAGGDGLLGVGFNLSVGSAITRCRKTTENGDSLAAANAQTNVLFNDQDAYCLDGQRLIPMGALDGGTAYRTEIDSLANAIAYNRSDVTGGPAYWKVFSKDGTERIYGYPNGNYPTQFSPAEVACVAPPAGVAGLTATCNGRVYRNKFENGSWVAGTEVMSWMLSKIRSRDPMRGAIEFAYETDQSSGEALLRQVLYSGSDLGVRPTAALRFYYMARPNPSVSYMGGARMRSSQMLIGVQSFNADGQLARRYDLDYWPTDLGVGSGRPRLKSITENNGAGVSNPPTVFDWSTTNNDFAPYSFGSAFTFENLNNFKYGDIDGDGRPEIVFATGSNQSLLDLKIARAQISASGISFSVISTGLQVDDRNADRERSWQIFDYNQDGRDDLMLAQFTSTYSGQWRIFLSNGSSFSTTPLTAQIPFTATSEGEAEAVTDSQIADFDGDGLVDFIAPALISGQVKLQIRFGVRATQGTLCNTSISSAPCPYEFGPPRTVAFDLPGGVQITLRGQDVERYEAFDANGDGRADLRLSVSCSSACLDNVSRSAVVASTSADYGVVAYESIPLMERADGDVPPKGDDADNSNNEYWVLLTHSGLDGTGAEAFRLYQQWKHNGAGAIVSGADENFRVADINGDGLADVVYEKKNSDEWYLQLNRGDGFQPARCALETGDVIGNASVCPRVDNSETIVLQDFNGDGRLDFWVGQEGGADQICAGGSSTNQRYAVKLGSESGFSGSPLCPDNLTAFGQDWISGMADLDGDGQIDVWGSDRPTSSTCTTPGQCYRVTRRSTRWQPRDAVTRITTGLGAQTEVRYAPLGFSTVYKRDYNAPFVTGVGRGAPLFDVQGPQYVVQFVSSSAPNIESPADPWVRVAYRYAGAKAQGGGRGSLGMRSVWSLDLQTNIETQTEYLQAWPLTGRAKATYSRYLGTSVPSFSACGGGPTVSANGDLSSCFVRAPYCVNGSGQGDPRLVCDAALPSSAVEMSKTVDEWTFRARTGLSTLSSSPGTLPIAPASVFIYQRASNKTTTDLRSDNLTASPELKYEETVFEGLDSEGVNQPGYDGNGNLLGSSAIIRDMLYVVRQRAQSNFSYVPGSLGVTWVPGLLGTSKVTTTRNGALMTRETHFEYESYGAVKVERIQPNGNFDTERLNVHTIRDGYGVAIAKVTCSAHFSDSQCTNWMDQSGTKIPASVIADPLNPYHIRRYEASVYDATRRFVDASISPFDSGSSANSPASAVAALTVLERNLYGEPTRTRDANDIVTRAQHTALGRQYHTYVVGSGVSDFSRYDWCVQPTGSVPVSTVVCPAGAVYRVENTRSGAPTSRTYFDQLGRQILSETQAYAAGQWSAVATGYDRLGRSIQASEPYFSSGADRRLCGSVPCTQVQYDILGRATLEIHPDDTPSRPVRTSTLYYTRNCAFQDSVSRCFAKRVTNAKNQSTFENTSVLGDLLWIIDANGFATYFDHDAHGNLAKVTRQPTDGDSAGQTIVTTAVFDNLGRRTSLTDPDMGTWSYLYNAAGEAIAELNANGQCVTSRYDVRGRLVERVDTRSATCTGNEESRSQWQFDLGSQQYGLLNSESEKVGAITRTSRSLEYDSLKRPVGTVTQIGTRAYRQEQSYDQHSRLFQSLDMVFVRGDVNAVSATVDRKVGVQYNYNAQGYQQSIVNAQLPSDVFYEVLQTNARGQVIEDRRGGSAALARTLYFDAATGRLTGMLSGPGGSIQNLDYGRDNPSNGYDVLGNLQFREDRRTGLKEAFGYDNLNRLTSATVTLNGQNPVARNFAYDQLGNFMSKADLGFRSSNYSGVVHSCPRATVGPNMVTRVTTASGSTVYCYDQNGNQISAGDGNPNSTAADQRLIEYAVHDKPLSVRTTGPNGRLTRYQYGPGREIVKRFDGPNATSTDTEVDYVGATEVYYRPDQGTTTDRREYKRHLANYLVITLSSERQSGTVVRSSTRHYRFEEKLGSLDVLTDRNGTIVQRMSFDVWGERRNESTWDGYSQAQIAAFNSSNSRKGYTGHEHIDQANLIHMGGRVYDPRIGRFLSADPLVQAPNNTQSFNRYSYVINNPMNYVDPSGYSWLSDNWRTVASIAISFYMPGMLTSNFGIKTLAAKILAGMAAGAVQSGSLKGALIGGFSAGMFHGIGAHFDGIAETNMAQGPVQGAVRGTGLTAGQFGAKIAAHATAGGVMGMLQGGKFGHSFASAGFGEAVSPAVMRAAGNSSSRRFITGVIVGGTASKMAGGKFANGAQTAAFQWAFNHGTAAVKRYSVAAGVALTSDIEGSLSTIADAYYAATSSEIVVTSGTRTAESQAGAMYDKFQAGGEGEVNLYRDTDSAQEIYDVYKAAIDAGSDRATGVSQMTAKIQSQIDAGTFISKHLKSGAVDVRSRDMTDDQKKAFRTAAEATASSVLLETSPPHWHLQF